jgi:hypothetical protein
MSNDAFTLDDTASKEIEVRRRHVVILRYHLCCGSPMW